MKNKPFIIISLIMMLSFFCQWSSPYTVKAALTDDVKTHSSSSQDQQSSNTQDNFNREKIEKTSQNVSLPVLIERSKELSVPVFVAMVVIAGFLTLLGIFFKAARKIAATIFGLGIIFLILVNYSPEVTGVFLRLSRDIVNFFTA